MSMTLPTGIVAANSTNCTCAFPNSTPVVMHTTSLDSERIEEIRQTILRLEQQNRHLKEQNCLNSHASPEDQRAFMQNLSSYPIEKRRIQKEFSDRLFFEICVVALLATGIFYKFSN
ncbi:MAG: hypothetical protein JWO53_833 [Chlamydiia bacterium]|nr:hypothetical protein [Chlamydiia bacterium]